MHVVLLPGLDGTGLLFAPLLATMPDGFSAEVISYPAGIQGYAAATQHVADRLPAGAPCLVVGESFSGPVAVRIAAKWPSQVAGVVLAAGVIGPLWPPGLSRLPIQLLRRLPLRSKAARLALLGPRSLPELDALLCRALRRVPQETLARRVHEVLKVDAAEDLRRIAVPMCYLQPTRDLLLGRRSGHRMQQVRPDAERVDVPGPHLILQYDPVRAWAAIARFAERSR